MGLRWKLGLEPAILRQEPAVGTGHIFSRNQQCQTSWLANNTPGCGLCVPEFFRLEDCHISLRATRPTHIGPVQQLSISDMARPGIF